MFNSISSCGTLRLAPWQRMPLWPWSMFNSIFLSFWLVGLHFLAFWPFRPSFNSLHFDLVGLHFFAFWPCGPSFPCILALRAFISFHFGLFGVSVWGSPPTSCQKWPVCPTSLQWIYQRRDRPHFAVFSILGLHFLAFWPCGPSFPCILALWAFISLHFGLHFLSFWPFRGRLLAPPPQVAKNGPFAQRPYNGFISAVTGSILQFLAFWALISLHFGLVGLHFLAFWPCGPSFPCILALRAFISFHFGLFGVGFWGPPTSCQKWPVCPTSLQWIYQRRDRLHIAVFSILGLHFLAFWPCGPSFPCILALWAFISFHFGLFGVGFWAPPHKLPKMARLPNVLTMDLSAP